MMTSSEDAADADDEEDGMSLDPAAPTVDSLCAPVDLARSADSLSRPSAMAAQRFGGLPLAPRREADGGAAQARSRRAAWQQNQRLHLRHSR